MRILMQNGPVFGEDFFHLLESVVVLCHKSDRLGGVFYAGWSFVLHVFTEIVLKGVFNDVVWVTFVFEFGFE